MPNDRCAEMRITVISSGGSNRLSMDRNRRCGSAAAGAATISVSAIGLSEAMKHVDLRAFDRLLLPGWPPDDHAVDGHAGAEAEVQPPLILRGETARRGQLLHLAPTVPLHF